jgi:hypothetical protein
MSNLDEQISRTSGLWTLNSDSGLWTPNAGPKDPELWILDPCRASRSVRLGSGLRDGIQGWLWIAVNQRFSLDRYLLICN